ncbi:histidinol phosphatase [Haloterrigena salifodinae]|uniref:histidinol-phosphatase n=1 Tax=Haloterrigena salifodinae TaxID=2675099 RepID=A0A8T8E5T3_9EURY|nr:PHP domain-containing protein [Haloterrigena salifodinae]QRV16826.1 histidinol phosphatase [Haloterrigena salifodinae]
MSRRPDGAGGSDRERGDDPAPRYDLHTHTRFSDGSEMASMIEAAVAAGYDGIGLTDHCILVDDDHGRRDRFDLVETYERRRRQIDELRERYPIDVFDAVECNYVPGTEARLEAFLEDADFEYAIGSVHLVEGCDVTAAATVADRSRAERRAVVDAYYEALVRSIESELFDVVGHVDLPERIEPLRGLTTDAHYRAVADALATSSTVPELNAGRARRGLGRLHPNPDALEPFVERDITFVLGSDAHAPREIRARSEILTDFVSDRPPLRLASPPLRSRP